MGDLEATVIHTSRGSVFRRGRRHVQVDNLVRGLLVTRTQLGGSPGNVVLGQVEASWDKSEMGVVEGQKKRGREQTCSLSPHEA